MNMKEKIAKILEKARSTNSEAEAEMLMAKAMQLMEEHQIQAHQLGDASDPMGMSLGMTLRSGPEVYQGEVQRALAAYYGCKVISIDDPLVWNYEKRKWKPKSWHFEIVGPESARVTTDLMHKYVWDQLKKLAKEQGARYGIKPEVQLCRLANAMVGRVWKLVREREAAEAVQARGMTEAGRNALALLDATEAEFNRRYPNTFTGKTSNKALKSNMAAKAAVANIGLHRQTTGTSNLSIGSK